MSTNSTPPAQSASRPRVGAGEKTLGLSVAVLSIALLALFVAICVNGVSTKTTLINERADLRAQVTAQAAAAGVVVVGVDELSASGVAQDVVIQVGSTIVPGKVTWVDGHAKVYQLATDSYTELAAAR